MKIKIALVLVLAPTLMAGFRYNDSLTKWVSESLWPSAEEPLPLLRLTEQPYQVKVNAQGRLTGLITTAVNSPKGRASLKIAWLIEEGKAVQKGDLLVRFDNTDAQLALEKHQTEVTSLTYRLGKTEADRKGTMGRMERDRQAAQLEFGFAQNQIRQDESIFSQWEIEESILSADLAQSRLQHLAGQERLHETLARADAQILTIERETAESEMSRARDVLSALEVRAPVDGVVLFKRSWRALEVGAEIWPEQPLMEIATQNRLQGELNVVETEVAGVGVGKPTNVRLMAAPERTFRGIVTEVAQVADQLNRNDPRRYFVCKVTVEIPPQLLPILKPGMYLIGEIVVNEYLSALVVPRSAVFKNGDAFQVFVSKGGEFVERQIQIRDADHGFYVVSGVNPGEEVCLRHPFVKQKLHLPDFSTPAGPTGGRARF